MALSTAAPCAESALDAAGLRALAKTVPRGRLLAEPGRLAAYGSDALGYKRHRPWAVAIPEDRGELIAVARFGGPAGGRGERREDWKR